MTARIGLLYHRDSEGTGSCAPSSYVEWAARRAAELGVTFTGTVGRMEAMVRRRAFADPPVFLDYGVSGNELSRPGLDAFLRAANDRSVSHVFIPRRDRLARPDHPMDGVKLELQLRQSDVTVVFNDRVVPPLPRGQRQDVGELIVSVLDYHYSGAFRHDLAVKRLGAQVVLAKAGFAIGGNPPYGFERWLVREVDYHPVRKLADGERTKMAGHHVCWLPTDEVKLAVLRRIVDFLEGGMSATRVAELLTAEQVPVPGQRRNTTGVWQATTVRNLATHPLLRAVVETGRRSEGDQLRFTPTDPRPLTDDDYRKNDGKAKVVVNPPSARIAVPARFDPIIAPARQEALVAEMDRRGASQRRRSRARGEAANPLGGRVWDMGCGWPMYRLARGPAYRYLCGLSQQSDNKCCSYNWVDGPTAARFVLGCVRQRLLSSAAQTKLQKKLKALAEVEAGRDPAAEEAMTKKSALVEVNRKLALVEKNMTYAESEAQCHAMGRQFDLLTAERSRLEAELQTMPVAASRKSADEEVTAALAVFDRLTTLAAATDDTQAVQELLNQVDAKLYLRFRTEVKGRRIVSKPAGGVLTLGSAPLPVPVYEGLTDKAYVKKTLAASGGTFPPELAPCSCDPGPEVRSSGNPQRLTRRCTGPPGHPYFLLTCCYARWHGSPGGR